MQKKRYLFGNFGCHLNQRFEKLHGEISITNFHTRVKISGIQSFNSQLSAPLSHIAPHDLPGKFPVELDFRPWDWSVQDFRSPISHLEQWPGKNSLRTSHSKRRSRFGTVIIHLDAPQLQITPAGQISFASIVNCCWGITDYSLFVLSLFTMEPLVAGRL